MKSENEVLCSTCKYNDIKNGLVILYTAAHSAIGKLTALSMGRQRVNKIACIFCHVSAA